jgi:HEAT repeat protein
MTQKTPFTKVVDALLDQSKPFPASLLHRFSDLSEVDLQLLMDAWPRISTRRKRTLLEDLEDLAKVDTITCFDELARSVLTDSDPQVRATALRLLRECEDVKLVSTYLSLLNDDPDPSVQTAAADILGQFVILGELEKITPDLHHLIEDQLLAVLSTKKESSVRRQALESLGYSGRAEVIPLIEAAFEDKDPDWVVSALCAMGHSCDDRWKKQVISKLRSPNELIRSAAIHAAGELELKTASPLLLDMLEDEEDLLSRRELVWALSRIGGEGVRAKLEDLLETEDEDEEIELIEEALDALSFTDELGTFNLLDIDPDREFFEEEPDEEE